MEAKVFLLTNAQSCIQKKKLKTESAKNSCSIQGQYTKFNPF